ncbi:MAG: ABC transporter permease [Salibacteraceae bacterium]
MIGGRRKGITGTGSSAIVKIAVAGIAIGLSVMLLSVAIVSGFQKEVRDKVIGFGAHLQVTTFNPQNTLGIKPVDRNQPFLPSIAQHPAVENVSAFAYKSGIIVANGEIQGIVAKGVDGEYELDYLRKNLVAGRAPNYGSPATNDSILISQKALKSLKLKVGDRVTASFFQDEKERKRRFIVAGSYETGLDPFDAAMVICDLRHVQKLNNWDTNLVAGFEIRLGNFEQLNEVEAYVRQLIGWEFNTIKITDQFMDIFGWLELQDLNVIIILTLMILVSGINMISALLVIILERTNLIGLLKAMGATTRSIGRVFLLNAIYLTLVGMFWGNLIGLGVAFLQHKFRFVKLDKESYYVDAVPVLINLNDIILINLGCLLACFVMLLLPVMVVSRIDPVKTIRFN